MSTAREPISAARTQSGLPIEPVYSQRSDFDVATALGEPGEFPYTRGVHRSMYTGRLWTMRQYAGFGTAAESNQRYRALLAAGTTGLSVAFDLPTQMGYDSDDPLAAGEVGKVGVAIDSIDDMRTLFDGIPLDQVSTSMTINAPAALLVLLYELVAQENGIAPSALRGTVQNDILKEYVARGTYIFPPRASMRLATDLFSYCQREIPQWNSISVSGYHLAEAGATPVQEVAFTLAHGIEYVRAAQAAGLDVDEFAPRLTFFFVARTTLLEEVAKFRAARRMWAHIMRTQFGAKDPRSQMLRFHTQTAGVQLTAQQPEVNLVRVTLQALAAVLGGTQSLHTNGYDEALALPSAKAARLAVRTQQVLAYETDLATTVDPFAGSYAVESMTDDLERAALALMQRVEALGGALAAVERGFQRDEIERSAYDVALAVERGERVVVGVNAFTTADDDAAAQLSENAALGQPNDAGSQSRAADRSASGPAVARSDDPAVGQIARLGLLRASRDPVAVERGLAAVETAAEGPENVLPSIKQALAARATLGEVCSVLRGVWGSYEPS